MIDEPQKNNETANKRGRSRHKALILMTVCFFFLILFKFLLSFPSSMDDFWSEAFSNGDTQVLYGQFKDSFKDRLSMEEWEVCINNWRQRVGPLKKNKMLSSMPYDYKVNGNESPSSLSKHGTMRKNAYKIIGHNGIIEVVAYFYHVGNEWLLSGFEVIPVNISMESYVDKEDVAITEKN